MVSLREVTYNHKCNMLCMLINLKIDTFNIFVLLEFYYILMSI